MDTGDKMCQYFKPAPTPDKKDVCWVTGRECKDPFKKCDIRKNYKLLNEKNRSV